MLILVETVYIYFALPETLPMASRTTSDSSRSFTASLRRLAANLTTSLSGEGIQYTLVPSAPTDIHRTSISTESEHSEGSSTMDNQMETAREQNSPAQTADEDRGRPIRRPRSFPETSSEKRAHDESRPDTHQGSVSGLPSTHQQVVHPPQPDHLHPNYNRSTSTFSDRSRSRPGAASRSSSRSCSRHGCSSLSAHTSQCQLPPQYAHRSTCSLHAHHLQSQQGGSKFTQHSSRSCQSHASQPSAMIRRPTSTFVIGPEPREEGPTIVEMKTALVQRALDESGMGRYQWCMYVSETSGPWPCHVRNTY